MTATTFTVNGRPVTHTGEDRTHLADFLRETKRLTGTHLGCEHGVCGACTLMVDGAPVRSCITYASACHAADIRTIEDFEDDPLMAKLRAAFQAHHGLQCGFCTPGMLATAYDIVVRLPNADEARIREELSGNLCRCTGYMGIVAAIRAVLETGPHVATAPPSRPVQIEASWTGPAAAVTAPAATSTAPQTIPMAIADGTTLSRVLDLESTVDEVWAVLTDLPTVADCLPGASIATLRDDGTVDGVFGVGLGPIKAQFRGTARVAFDPAAQSGTVIGSGGDAGTRSRAEGQIVFALSEQGETGSYLKVNMTYKLNGALAQFGRPRIVEAVVDTVLSKFAKNLARTTAGPATSDAVLPKSSVRRIVDRLTGQREQD